MRNPISGGATLNLAGGIRGRRRTKGHIINLKNQQVSSPDTNNDEPYTSNVEGYQTPDKKRQKIAHPVPLESMVGDLKPVLHN